MAWRRFDGQIPLDAGSTRPHDAQAEVTGAFRLRRMEAKAFAVVSDGDDKIIFRSGDAYVDMLCVSVTTRIRERFRNDADNVV